MLSLTLAFLVGFTQQPTAFTKELRDIVLRSQNDRKPGVVLSVAEQDKFFESHSPRLKRVREMIARDYLQIGEDYILAATVMHYGPSSDDAVVAHELAVVGAMKGRLSSLAAIGEDLYLLRCQRRQRFGTQFWSENEGKPILEFVDEEKPLAVTDGLRLDVAVPPLTVSKERVLESMTAAAQRIQERLKERINLSWIETMAMKPVARELRELAKSPDSKGYPKVLELYNADQLSTPDDYYNAALILSTSTESIQLLLAHELAAVAAMRQHPQAPRLFAETWDKYLVSVQEKPRYGTKAGVITAASVGPGVLKALGLR